MILGCPSRRASQEALIAVPAQAPDRLVRPLCWSCRVEEPPDAVPVVVMDHVGLACLLSLGEDA